MVGGMGAKLPFIAVLSKPTLFTYVLRPLDYVHKCKMQIYFKILILMAIPCQALMVIKKTTT